MDVHISANKICRDRGRDRERGLEGKIEGGSVLRDRESWS